MMSESINIARLTALKTVREAQAAGWPESESLNAALPEVRLWANDLVALVKRMRTSTAALARKDSN
jgi:hypothetical protein